MKKKMFAMQKVVNEKCFKNIFIKLIKFNKKALKNSLA